MEMSINDLFKNTGFPAPSCSTNLSTVARVQDFLIRGTAELYHKSKKPVNGDPCFLRGFKVTCSDPRGRVFFEASIAAPRILSVGRSHSLPGGLTVGNDHPSVILARFERVFTTQHPKDFDADVVWRFREDDVEIFWKDIDDLWEVINGVGKRYKEYTTRGN
jgi:hypothetical protein